MQSATERTLDVRYEPDEQPPPAVAVGLAAQYALLAVSGIVITPAVVVRAGGGSDAFLAWATFAALAISGVTTILQAVRLWRIGAGYILLMGTSGAFIAVCVTALVRGGPGLLATLVATSALFQFVLSARLSLLRRVFTPVVSGTVIMLIPVTVMPIVFDMLTAVPAGAASAAAPVSAAVTLGAVIVITVLASGVWRLWALAIGTVIGCLVAGAFGLYDGQRVLDAAWIGLPTGGWPGFDLTFGTAFWSLLPAFVFVTLIGAIETLGDSVAIQRVSWRQPRATDFRAVQGAVAADGLGNLLSGLAATVPNTTYSSSVSITEITGVAARTVGIYIGLVFIVLAFVPKFMALILAIPGPVVAAYLIVLLAILFVLGMRVVIQEGIDYRKGVAVGVAFWMGVGFQNQSIFADYFNEFWAGLLENGMTTGGLTVILMMLFMELTQPQRRRTHTELNVDAYPKVDDFLVKFAADRRLGKAMTERLRAVGEETLLTLIRQEDEGRAREGRRLLLVAHRVGAAVELEFVAATDETNIEDQIALLGERVSGVPVEEDVSLRLLQHYASSVRHQQYHDTDVVTVRVEHAGAA